MGSKEGWTPSTFVSSRSNRYKDSKDSKNGAQQRPEDFMDDEDIRDAEESKKLFTNEEYSGFGATAEDAKRKGALIDLFRPSGETKGVQLLKRMGWRQGQGIGPKVRRKLKQDVGDDDDGEMHLLPPENPPLIAFVHKTDSKGLGYGGEAKLESRIGQNTSRSGSRGGDVSSDDEGAMGPAFAAPKAKKQAKQSGRKGGFGVGILNDTGSDDEDPYEMGPKISYSRTIGGDKPKKKKETLGGSNPLLKSKPTFVSKKKTSPGFRRCHDGRLPPDGFVLSTQLDAFSAITLNDDSFKPPYVPEDWKSKKTPQQSESNTAYVSTAEAAKASSLDAKARAALLGEAQLPGKSVFDFLTPSTRDRIAQISGKTNLPAALGEKPPPGYETSEADKQRNLEESIPQLAPEVALQALNRGIGGWMPYSEDLPKRSRYQSFLSIRAGLRPQGVLPEKLPEMTRDNWLAELNEFARAAQVFKPVSGMMASRFTSSTQQVAGNNPSSASSDSLLSKPTPKLEDPAEQAAKLGMFGPLTRSITNFYPTRLLCKRFNVKSPVDVVLDPGDGSGVAAPHATSASYSGMGAGAGASGSRFQSAGFQTNETLPPSNMPLITSGKEGGEESTPASDAAVTATAIDELIAQEKGNANAALVTVDAERNEALEAERPGEAVFKAIFGSDDEDDD